MNWTVRRDKECMDEQNNSPARDKLDIVPKDALDTADRLCSAFPHASTLGFAILDDQPRCARGLELAGLTCYRLRMNPCLSDHFKSGQPLSLQNRPMEDARDLTVLPCPHLIRQV
jgi:hypothetical protein